MSFYVFLCDIYLKLSVKIEIQIIYSSICSFSNSISVAILDGDKIAEIEQTVRDEFGYILKTEEYDVFEYIDKMCIYGLYGSKVDRFRFMPGERALLNKMVVHINSFKVDALNAGVEADLEESFRSDHFNMSPHSKISRKDVCRSPIGLLFGKKTKIVHQTSAESTDSLPLISKENVLRKCNDRLKPLDFTLTEDQIKIVNDGSRIFAYVSCPLCEGKEIVIQCDVPKNSKKFYWNASNYSKHLAKHKNEKDIKNVADIEKENKSDNIQKKRSSKCTIQPFQEQNYNLNRSKYETNTENSFIELMSSNNSTVVYHTEDSLTNSIYQKLSDQNLKLTTAIMSNNETIEEMEFQLNVRRTINVVRMNGDGACMFSALAHQIFFHKVNSKQHQEEAKKLRRDVVKHIENHFDQFEHIIITRLQDDEEKYSQLKGDTWEQKSRNFTKYKLSKFNCWGGTESLKAISEMYSVNILIFNEDDVCWFPFEFDSEFERVVALAYRFSDKENGERNHYDSISEVGKRILYECASVLARNEIKRIDLKENKDEILNIDESVDF